MSAQAAVPDHAVPDHAVPGVAVPNDVVEAVLAAARVLVAVSAQSVAAESPDPVTLPQLRVLVMLASEPSMNLGGVAARLGVHPSNATRAVDRLVAAGLLDRRDDPADRRNLLLELTAAGHTLVEDVMQRRRATIAAILGQMSSGHQQQFAAGAAAFATAGGDYPSSPSWSTVAWSLGWTTTP